VSTNDLYEMFFGGPSFGPAFKNGFVQPKNEHALGFEERLQSRLLCNKFIIEKLRGRS
jgi:hypothetical protein